jgi:predicted nucleic acid-binding protein
MVILDTNVLSALMLETPDEAVVLWLDRQARTSVWTTAITTFEIRAGLEIMPPGRRRVRLEAGFIQLLREQIEGRVLPFDQAAADAAATLIGRRHTGGQPRKLRDTMMAGIVVAQRATLATRNVRHFDDLDVRVVDPWHDR